MPFGSLWIPVIVSAVVVFVASSILHMAIQYHKADHKPLPNEDAVRDVLARGNLAPGVYFTPHCPDMKQLKEPAIQAKFEKGPVAIITIMPKGAPVMQKHLALWFLHAGDDGMLVMRTTGTVAFAAYALSHVSDSIWKAQPWANTGRATLDGVIYALLTGLTFRMLWPAA
ncbi:MAG: hypothetical protein DMF50_12455 [Acidobacteria bacterium]|nr:MAG: hypothetical protein DMF50_12455 [Acidobacteriota bacterium]